MRLIDKMAEKVRSGLRSFLKIEPAQTQGVYITEKYDYETNAAKNRIWYRGEASEIEQFFKSVGNRTLFWAAVPTSGFELQKRHTGLPGIIIDTLTSVVLRDLNDISVPQRQSEWELIAKDNKIKKLIESAIKETLCVGDGAFKISVDGRISPYPIIEYVPGDSLEYQYSRGRISEIVFKTVYIQYHKAYVLKEYYGNGCIRSKLYDNEREVPLKTIPELKDLQPEVSYDGNYKLAVPFQVFQSSKWKGRGKSVFDSKSDSFDSLDETWSQWMDALRKGRSKEYIPEMLIPRNEETGQLMRPNPFDNSFIAVGNDMGEKAENKIELVQPDIPHDSYLSTYVTALDLCLQGVISPSTLGIDTKKLDNAEAQREKEKTTLYTRNKIIESLEETLPELVNAALKAFDTINHQPAKDYSVKISFGEYANPSFESQVETVGKAKAQGIMSIEAAVDELYGDSKDETWKLAEVERIRAENGVEQIEPMAVGMDGMSQENQENKEGRADKFIEEKI